MLIPIITTCKKPVSVPPYVLDRMLACGEVHAFERSTGWAVVGRDPVRAARVPFNGTDRRHSISYWLK
jgi:hypothetical protein